jgi:hypothetical protein
MTIPPLLSLSSVKQAKVPQSVLVSKLMNWLAEGPKTRLRRPLMLSMGLKDLALIDVARASATNNNFAAAIIAGSEYPHAWILQFDNSMHLTVIQLGAPWSFQASVNMGTDPEAQAEGIIS